MIRVILAAAAVAGVTLAGSAKAASLDEMIAAMKLADATCNAQGFKTNAAVAQCYNTGEEQVWQNFAPEGLPYYETWAATRLQLNSEIDTGAVTQSDGLAQLEANRQLFAAQINALSTQEQTVRQQTEQAKQQQQYQNWVALNAVAAYFQGKAASAAAAPKTQHTNCMWIAAQWSCTTTPY